MGSASLEGVQRLLHLDVDYPQFKSYVLNLEFEVDSVTVRAVANVSWRGIQVDITVPWQILAYDFQPPLFALQIMALRRREILKNKGITEIEDFIERCKIAYHRHGAYLRVKDQIGQAQDDFMCVFREEIQLLEKVNNNVSARVTFEKSTLRRRLKSLEIDQTHYQAAMKLLTKEASDASYKLNDLTRQVNMELDLIQFQMINQALSKEVPSTLI